MIHSTAIIDKNARIGQDVEIGPFSIVEGDVEIDDGSQIGAHVYIANGARLGKKVKIHQGTVVALRCRRI